jgi:hypothetical protein
LIFSPEDAQPATLAEELTALADGAAALLAGALEAAALGDPDSGAPELPVFLPHAAASSAVHTTAAHSNAAEAGA